MLTPPPSARFGVISDIDDTVLVSHVTSPFKMALVSLFGNAHTRSPFPGVAEFYQALQGGVGGAEQNPIFYVSSSPWNFYDLLHFFTGTGSAKVAKSEAAKYGAKVSKIAFGEMAGAHTFTVSRTARPMTEADFDVWA